MKKIIITLLMSLAVSELGYAEDYDPAFLELNKAVYEIENEREICNELFTMQSNRNDGAYEEWESIYIKILRELDDDYNKWKSIFDLTIQQQFMHKEAHAKKVVSLAIRENLKEGGEEKCHNYLPSLKRPRSNVEHVHLDAYATIRSGEPNDYKKQNKTILKNDECTWEQSTAKQLATRRDKGITEKAQLIGMKTMKKSNSTLDKKSMKKRLKKVEAMVSEVYKHRLIGPLVYSQYRFSNCDADRHGLKHRKLKKAIISLKRCQSNYPNDWETELGLCVHEALVK